MIYNEDFIKFIGSELTVNKSNGGYYVGTGNPNCKILIIGKETAIDVENKAGKDEDYTRFQTELLEDFNSNNQKWKLNCKNNNDFSSVQNWIPGQDSPLKLNPLFPFKGMNTKTLKEGHTWRKYQKLHDLIFVNDILFSIDKEFSFHEKFFLSEMNGSPAKHTKDADKTGILRRKDLFKITPFYQNFKVVLLACSNYINGTEIENIFNVRFDKQYGSGKQLFWTHYNSDQSKLVIHTRQLSTNVSDDLLRGIANEISSFIKLQKQ